VMKPREAEPVYEGKTLSEWLLVEYWSESMTASPYVGQIIVGHGNREAEEAIRGMGTNGIPTLLRLLRAKDSALKARAMSLLTRQRVIHVEYQPDHVWNNAASMGFKALGTNGYMGLPELIEIAKQRGSPLSQLLAIRSLGYLGPSAKEAVPSLLRWATNSNNNIRSVSINVLRQIDPEAAAKAGFTNSP
jgi:hypothetical protein